MIQIVLRIVHSAISDELKKCEVSIKEAKHENVFTNDEQLLIIKVCKQFNNNNKNEIFHEKY